MDVAGSCCCPHPCCGTCTPLVDSIPPPSIGTTSALTCLLAVTTCCEAQSLSQNLPVLISSLPHVCVRAPCECQSPLSPNQPGPDIRGWLEGHLGGPLPL